MGDSIGVSAFLEILNETLGFAYPEVVIQGEVSGYKVSQNKWAFFDIKDDKSTLPCFMPVWLLKVPIEDGMNVKITGSPKVRNDGRFSFTVRALDLAGEGELRRAFELLKAKLELEGLFDVARKRAMPAFPRRIGLVTSVGSAAYHDFIKIMGERWGGLDVTVADVVVQGATAPDSVVAALSYLNSLAAPLDVLVLIRGGGSLEDLAAFSTEPVARAVAASRTPIIVGVGHEIDTSLADLSADVRAATPTDAARLVVPDRREVGAKVQHLGTTIDNRLIHRIGTIEQRLVRTQLSLARFIERPRGVIERSQQVMRQRLQSQLNSISQQVASLARLLSGLDPKATLQRGYAIVRYKGAVLRDPATVKSGDQLMIQLAKGKLGAQVHES